MNSASTRRPITQISLLLAICLAIFFNAFTNDFVWDDPSLISQNRYVRDLKNIPLFFTPYYWNVLHPYADIKVQYRPVRTMTFAVDYYFWKLNPVGYHLTNLLLHMANVVLIFYLVLLISGIGVKDDQAITDRHPVLMGLPFLTAVLFATHPVHTESVTYIKNRSELLAFLFFMAALILFIRSGTAGRWLPRLLLLLASLLSFTLAVLSKETALTLPAVLALYVVCFAEKKERVRSFVRLIPHGLVALLFLWFIRTMLNNSDLSPSGVHIDFGRHVLAVIKTIGTYLALLGFPEKLSAEHAFSIPESVREYAVALSLAGLIVIGVLTARAWRWSKPLFFAIIFLLVTLLPASNIIFLWSRPIAEQRLYIPSFGFCLLLSWFIHYLYSRGIKGVRPEMTKSVAGLLTALIVFLFAVKTVNRNFDWRDPLTFYSRTIKSNPYSARMYNNLGNVLSEMGDHEKAIAQYEIALRLEPAYAHAYNNLGVEMAEAGRYDEAIQCYENALKIDPDYVSAHSNLGTVLVEQGHIEDALSHYKTAAQLKPDPEMLNDLGSAYAITGRLDDAMDYYLASLRIEPDFMLALNNLGALLIKTEKIDETVGRFLVPAFSAWQLARVYNSIATLYMKDNALSAAEKYYRKAVQTDPGYSDGLYNLGMALAFEKKYREAADVYARILTMSPDEKTAQRRYAFCIKKMAAGSE